MSEQAAPSDDRHEDDIPEANSADAAKSGPIDRATLAEQLDTALEDSPVGLVLIEVGIDESVAPLSSADSEHAMAAVNDYIAGQAERGDITMTIGPRGWAVIRTAISAPAEAEGLAYRLHKVLTEPVIIGDRKMSNRAAIGVVTSLGGDSGERLLRHAEHALGDAKMLGGDRVVIFDDEDRDLLLP